MTPVVDPVRITEEPSPEQRESLLHRERRALHVDPEDLVEMLLGDRLERQERATARVGEQDVDAAGLLADLLEKAIEIIDLRDVALNTGRVAADFADGGVKLGLAAAGDEEARALRGETLCGREADAAVRAGDDDNLAFKSAHDVVLQHSVRRGSRAPGSGPSAGQ